MFRKHIKLDIYRIQKLSFMRSMQFVLLNLYKACLLCGTRYILGKINYECWNEWPRYDNFHFIFVEKYKIKCKPKN